MKVITDMRNIDILITLKMRILDWVITLSIFFESVITFYVRMV